MEIILDGFRWPFWVEFLCFILIVCLMIVWFLLYRRQWKGFSDIDEWLNEYFGRIKSKRR